MNKKKFISGIMATALIGASMATIPANAEIQDTYTATMMGQVGAFGVWDDSCTVDITGDGQYALEWDFDSATQASEGSGAIFIDTNINPYDFLPEGYTPVNEDGTTAQKAEIAKATGITLSVDSVEVDGVEITYNGPSEGAYVCESDDSGNRLRLNVYNVWGNEVSDIDFSFAVESSIKVVFSVTGLDEVRENAEYTAGAGDTTTTTTTVTTTTAEDEDNDEGKIVSTTDDGKTVTTTTAKTTVGSSSSSTTTKTATSSSANTGDSGVAAVLVALGLATITATALRKKD